MPMPSAHIHEAISAWLAPTARAAWKTITAELAKPTNTVMKPAITDGNDISRNNERLVTADIACILDDKTCIVSKPAPARATRVLPRV